MSPEMTGKLLRGAARGRHRRGAGAGRSSPREREIVACLARGASNKEIARELDIAESTVKIHVQHILRKLELGSPRAGRRLGDRARHRAAGPEPRAHLPAIVLSDYPGIGRPARAAPPFARPTPSSR